MCVREKESVDMIVHTGVTPSARLIKNNIAAARSEARYCLSSISRRVKLAIAYSSSL